MKRALAHKAQASAVFAKLNFSGRAGIVILNSPDSFQAEVNLLRGVEVCTNLKSAGEIPFALIFVQRQMEIGEYAALMAAKASGDAIVWFAYPKGSSKKYQSDINRDAGWQPMRQLGFDTVRQVAIDDDWSALRFRRVEFIGSKAR
jgi:hypothetical protein